MKPINSRNIDIPILPYLSDKFFVSGEYLSGLVGISRVAVWKQIQKLKKLGYHIFTNGRKGYRIISRPDILLPSEILRNLDTKYIGKNIFYFPQVTSTNSIAKENLKNKKEVSPFQEGTVFIAEVQTEGRGRLGRDWYSPSGGIWLTILLFPCLEPIYIQKITLMTAVVLVRSIKDLLDIDVHIKWPNDLLLGNKKISGILTEMVAESDRIDYLLIGIGINANTKKEDFPQDTRKYLISLQEILGKPVSRIELVQQLLEKFEEYYDRLQKKQFDSILEEWKKNSDTLGREITIESAGKIISGRAINITSEGALVIRKDNGELLHILSGTLQR